MNELYEIEYERESLYSIPSWEWEPDYDKALERLAKKKLEILAKEEGA